MQQPTVWYEGHLHPLTVLEDIPSDKPRCQECGRPRDSPPCHECGRPRDSPPVLPVFHCARCDFNLHLLCGPLPTKIQPPEFDWPLILADSYAENDSGECYCDFCPEKRDPRDCVYHSENYYYIAHVTCVKDEVLRSLKGERGDVELRTLGKLIPGKAVSKESNSKFTDEGEEATAESSPTLKEIYDSLTENELMEFKNLSIDSAGSSSGAATTTRDTYSNEDFEQLLGRLDAVTVTWEELTKFYNMDAKVVDVEGHQITRDFAKILEKFMRKHNRSIAEPSSLSPNVKTFVLVLLCDVVYGMYRTKIEDVTEQMLKKWWGRLKVVRRSNFRVQPVVAHLTQVVAAYFGHEAKKFYDALDEKIDRLSKELEELKAGREQYQTTAKSERPVLKKCLAEASALSWKTVGADLL